MTLLLLHVGEFIAVADQVLPPPRDPMLAERTDPLLPQADRARVGALAPGAVVDPLRCRGEEASKARRVQRLAEAGPGLSGTTFEILINAIERQFAKTPMAEVLDHHIDVARRPEGAIEPAQLRLQLRPQLVGGHRRKE